MKLIKLYLIMLKNLLTKYVNGFYKNKIKIVYKMLQKSLQNFKICFKVMLKTLNIAIIQKEQHQ